VPVTLEFEYYQKNSDNEIEFNLLLLNNIPGITIKVPFIRKIFFPLFSKIKAEVDSYFLNFWSTSNIIIEKEITPQNININNLKKFITIISNKKLIKIVFFYLNLKCDYFFWKTKYGFKNPFYTGTFNGLIWTFKNFILNKTNNIICQIKQPKLYVNPDFHNNFIETHFKSIFKLYLGNIFLLIIRLFFYIIKRRI